MRFPDGFLDEIRDRLSVSAVVGRHVKLQRRGREYVGLSPFNKEKTPSFTVNDQKGFFHCFSSGEHGDIFGFLMKTQGLSFHEAVERLAAEAGLEVPQAGPAEQAATDQRKRLFDLLGSAARYFSSMLGSAAGSQASRYLGQRGVEAATAAAFRLGYAPSGQGLLDHLAQAGFSPEAVIEAGLAKRPDDGRRPYSFFRNRLIFPVFDGRGRVIAFGGRILSGDGPKYINSPETAVFAKGRTLYAQDQARPAAHQGHSVIVVEGYMDVISLNQAGYRGTVAPLGTALTESQMELLWRMTGQPTICFDGDRAGRQAAGRAADRILPMLRADHTLKFAFLPEGEDPDSIVRQSGASGFKAVLDTAFSVAELIWRFERQRHDLGGPEGKAGLRAALMGQAGRIGDRVVQDLYRRDFTERFDGAFARAPQRRRRGQEQGRRPKSAPVPHAGPPPTQFAGPRNDDALARFIVMGIARHPVLFEEFAEFLGHLAPRSETADLQRHLFTLLTDMSNPGAGGERQGPGLDFDGIGTQFEQAGHGASWRRLVESTALRNHAWLKAGATVAEVREGLLDLQATFEADRLVVEVRRASETAAPGDGTAYVARLVRARAEGSDAEWGDG